MRLPESRRYADALVVHQRCALVSCARLPLGVRSALVLLRPDGDDHRITDREGARVLRSCLARSQHTCSANAEIEQLSKVGLDDSILDDDAEETTEYTVALFGPAQHDRNDRPFQQLSGDS